MAEKALAATGVGNVSAYTVTPSGQVSTRQPSTCSELPQQQQQNPTVQAQSRRNGTLSSIWTGSPTQKGV